MAYFPLFLDLSDKKCMIFGGGNVAFRKMETLLKYDADFEVISKTVIPEIEEILPVDKIHLVALSEEAANQEESAAYWLSQADLVIAATSSRVINASIAKWCHENHTLVNVIDAPEECSFLFPSVVKRGDISIGINTGGKSPIVSKQVRKDIEEAIPDYYGEVADFLGHMRDYVKDNFSQEKDRRAILKALAARSFAEKRPLTEEEIQLIVANI